MYIHSHRLNAIGFEQDIREFINQRESSGKKSALSHFLLNRFQIWKDLLHAQQVFEVALFIILGSASTWLATELANRYALPLISIHTMGMPSFAGYEPYLTEYLIRC